MALKRKSVPVADKSYRYPASTIGLFIGMGKCIT